MTDAPVTADSIRSLWQSMPTTPVLVSPLEMRARAKKFEGRVRRRNFIEYGATAFVVVVFGWYATFKSTTILWPIANLLIVAAALFVAFMLHRKARAAATPREASMAGLIDFHRGALIRQRDALKSLWLWYVMPFVPGIVLWITAMWMQRMAKGDVHGEATGVIILVIGFTLVNGGLILLNLLGAAWLQRLIDDLDRYKEKT